VLKAVYYLITTYSDTVKINNNDKAIVGSRFRPWRATHSE